MEFQVGVKILLKNRQGKFLLARRNPEKYPDMRPGWDIIGGRINAGADLLTNLRREILEETGLEYQGAPKLIAAQDIIRPGKHVVRLTYFGEIEGEPKLSEEHLEVRWFSGDEIKALDVSILDSYFKELLNKKIINL